MTWPSLPATATTAEVVWTAATAVATMAASTGLAFTGINLRAAQRAHRRALDLKPLQRLYVSITWQAVRNERIAIVVMVILTLLLLAFSGVGVLAMLTPAPVQVQVRAADMIATVVLVVGAILLAAASALLTAGSALNRRDRHRLTNQITGRILAEIRERRLFGRRPASTKDAPS